MKEHLIKWSESIIPWLLSSGIKVIVIIIGSFILSKILKRIIERAIRVTVLSKNYVTEEDEKKRENTLIRIFSGIIKTVIFSIAIMMILSEFGLKIGPILAGAGIVGLAVGFGGQYLIRDIISGLFIIIENQYRVGDVVNFDGVKGTVEDISLRVTILRDIDGTVHHVPHGQIKIVSNTSKYFARVNINLAVAYDSDIEKVISVINKVGEELADDTFWKEYIIKAPQYLRIEDFADSAIIFKVLGETQALKQADVAGEFRKRIKTAFDKEGIEMPFPQIVINKSKEK